MIPPSNWSEELVLLRKSIEARLNQASKQIVQEEILKILGRVKILTSVNLQNNQYTWYIESQQTETKNEQK